MGLLLSGRKVEVVYVLQQSGMVSTEGCISRIGQCSDRTNHKMHTRVVWVGTAGRSVGFEAGGLSVDYKWVVVKA